MKQRMLITSLSLPSVPSVPKVPPKLERANTNPSVPKVLPKLELANTNPSNTTSNWSLHFTRTNSLNSPRNIQIGTNINSCSDSTCFPIETELNQDIQPSQIIKKNASQIISIRPAIESVSSLLPLNIPLDTNPNIVDITLKNNVRNTIDTNKQTGINLKQARIAYHQAKSDLNQLDDISNYNLCNNMLEIARKRHEEAIKLDNNARKKKQLAVRKYTNHHYKLDRTRSNSDPIQCNPRFPDILNSSRTSSRFVTTSMIAFKYATY
jgi:hypothetical protein